MFFFGGGRLNIIRLRWDARHTLELCPACFQLRLLVDQARQNRGTGWQMQAVTRVLARALNEIRRIDGKVVDA